jgi:hypothetical protein
VDGLHSTVTLSFFQFSAREVTIVLAVVQLFEPEVDPLMEECVASSRLPPTVPVHGGGASSPAAAGASASLLSDRRALEALSMPPVLSLVATSDPLLPLDDVDERCLMTPALYEKALEQSCSLVNLCYPAASCLRECARVFEVAWLTGGLARRRCVPW